MGSGVSKEQVDRLGEVIKQKDEEIQQLKNQIQHMQPILLPRPSIKQNEISRPNRPTIVRQHTVGSSNQTILNNKPNPNFIDSGIHNYINTKKLNGSNIGNLSSTNSSLNNNLLLSNHNVHNKKDDDLVKFSKKQRRLEVSAEVMKEMGKGINKIQYNKKIYPKDNNTKELILSVIKTNILFNGLGKDEQNDCVDAFFQVLKDPGDIVINQGDQGDYFFVVESGKLDIWVSTQGAPAIKFGQISEKMGFGELALLCNNRRAATIQANTEVILWAIERSIFRAICTHYELLRREKALSFLQNVSVLKKLSTNELEQVATAMEWEEYGPGTVIVREGEVGEDFYVIESGEVTVSKVNQDGMEIEIRLLKGGDHFGEMALLKDDQRSATCIAKTNVVCLTLSRDNLCGMLGSLQELIERDGKPITKSNLVKDKIVSSESNKYHKDILMKDLDIIQTLGCGAFGRVKLVKHKISGETYALKCLTKANLVSNNLTEHVVSEKKVMKLLDHPFILRLHNTYKDTRYIYFLLELALGGELFTYLRRRDRFNEQAARFFVASVVLAFQHMHERNIAYRDLKPENLILDSAGFLKVVDFGLAKVVHDRTWTLCGTPDYLAPEIILNKGHDKAVDYWALGVLIYELIAGVVPFYADDPMQVYSLVLSSHLKFPSYFGRPCVDIIQRLLAQNPTRRIGNMKNGIKDIIRHKWFSGFDWDGLLNKTIEPPIRPKVQNNMDASNFDHISDDGDEDPPPCAWDPEF